MDDFLMIESPASYNEMSPFELFRTSAFRCATRQIAARSLIFLTITVPQVPFADLLIYLEAL
jgi:hypothetical protein